jgi:hypothetical protein
LYPTFFLMSSNFFGNFRVSPLTAASSALRAMMFSCSGESLSY